MKRDAKQSEDYNNQRDIIAITPVSLTAFSQFFLNISLMRMKSLETCIEDCQQRGAKIGLWSAQLEAIKAAFKLPVTGEVA